MIPTTPAFAYLRPATCREAALSAEALGRQHPGCLGQDGNRCGMGYATAGLELSPRIVHFDFESCLRGCRWEFRHMCLFKTQMQWFAHKHGGQRCVDLVGAVVTSKMGAVK